MLSSGLPPLLLVLSVLELSWSLSDEEKKIILDEHNKYRSQVSPPAMAMMKMTWDMDLEVAAENHAGNCSWNRNSGPTKKNLFATNSTLDVKLAIEEWNGERKFYNFSTSQCEPGKICDDYIQVIWSITNRVGCGSKFCKKVEDIKAENVQLLVCTYHPWSNTEKNKPYWTGPSCTTCPTGTVCVDNLCEERKTNSDSPKDGAASTCLGFSLFLLPSAILVGLLL